MRKKVKKYGGSCVIVLTREDMACWDLHLGDIVDFNIGERFVDVPEGKD